MSTGLIKRGHIMNLENYKAYANSEAEAQEIVTQVNADNGVDLVTYANLSHSPSLWEITIHIDKALSNG
jgi:hypothetical protein